MLKPMLLLVLALGAAGAPLGAQVSSVSPFNTKQLDAAQMAGMIANSQRMLKPASFVLSHKADLGLTPEQVRQIDLLVRDEEDSVVVRRIRLNATVSRQMQKLSVSNSVPPTGWAGPIDEKQLRDQACEQSGLQVEFMLSLFRDRQVVGNILTGTQIDRLQELEVGDAMRAIKAREP